MKIKFTLLSCLLIGTMLASAQGYTFLKTSSPYAHLSGEISLTQGMVWDDPEYEVVIGFPFPFWGVTTVDKLLINDFGVFTENGEDTAIVTSGADLLDRGYISGISASDISYKLEGSAPNQIFKVQWKNVGFYEEEHDLGTLNWYANIQLWLYSNGMFEIHLGPTFIGDPNIAFDGEPGPAFGYGEEMNSWFLTGPVALPVLSNFTNGNIGWLTGVPTDGTVYRFTPSTIGIENPKPELLINVSTDDRGIKIQTPVDVTVNLVNLAGQLVLSRSLIEGESLELEYGLLPAGVYIFHATDTNHRPFTSKVFLR